MAKVNDKMADPDDDGTPGPLVDYLEKAHQKFLQDMRESGLTVNEREPSDSTEYKATFPAGRRPPELTLKPVTVSVEWGYELHSVDISAKDWQRIQRGERIVLRSDGRYEGTAFEIRWTFDANRENSLSVSYRDDGATGFIGKISHATIEYR